MLSGSVVGGVRLRLDHLAPPISDKRRKINNIHHIQLLLHKRVMVILDYKYIHCPQIRHVNKKDKSYSAMVIKWKNMEFRVIPAEREGSALDCPSCVRMKESWRSGGFSHRSLHLTN